MVYNSSDMCGIFGYIGPRQNAAEIIFEGLKTLEYRGYDSWGIALKNQGEILIEKQLGKLPEVIPDSKFLIHNSSLGIGHTRWATHGGVTQENAHPHYDCTKQIAVLHNGIIENYEKLKQELLKKGHTFTSETDSEVIAHLLEENLTSDMNSHNARGGGLGGPPSSARSEQRERGHRMGVKPDRTPSEASPFTTAMQQTFAQLTGLNAIVAINANSEEIVAAKNGSPIIVGIGHDEYFLSSDLAGILPYTKTVVFLKDNELVTLSSTNNLKLFSLLNGSELTPEIETIDWKIENAVKGTYEHFMLKEIHEQPRIIETIAKSYTDQITQLAQVINDAKGTFFIGSGTAFNACLAGTYLFSNIAKKHVNTAPASEFNYLEDFLTSESLIIPLSQSGETIDVIEPLTRAKKKQSKIISLVNVLGSTLYRMGDYKLLLGAGPEKAVASTKAYIAKITILMLLSYAIIDQQKTAKKILINTAKEVDRLLEETSINTMKKLAKLLAKKNHIYIIGRGVSYATALEGALKIKEVSYIPTEGLAGGELKHGTIALIEKGTPCIVIAPDDETHDAILSNAMEIKSRGGYIIGIAAKNSPIFDEWIEVRETHCPLITTIVPLQLLAYFIATTKNLDPDKPRNLAKSVTVK